MNEPIKDTESDETVASPVDVKILAGHVTGCVGGQENDRPGKIGRISPAAEDGTIPAVFPALGIVPARAVHVGVEITRPKIVHTNAKWSQIKRQRAGQLFQRPFGGDVGRVVRETHFGTNTGEIRSGQ